VLIPCPYCALEPPSLSGICARGGHENLDYGVYGMKRAEGWRGHLWINAHHVDLTAEQLYALADKAWLLAETFDAESG
jgi:hypothetical protein